MTTNNNMVHIFEAAGLGKGPFHLHHVTAEGGSCQYCGTGIVFRFYLSGQDSRIFFVGSDCVLKSNDAGLIKVVAAEVKKRQAELRQKRETEKFTALKNHLSDPSVKAELSAQPHPYAYYAKQGKTKLDYIDYVLRFGGKTAKLALAKTLLLAKTKDNQPTV